MFGGHLFWPIFVQGKGGHASLVPPGSSIATIQKLDVDHHIKWILSNLRDIIISLKAKSYEMESVSLRIVNGVHGTTVCLVFPSKCLNIRIISLRTQQYQ